MMRSSLTRRWQLLAATLLLSIIGRSQLAAQLPPSNGTSEFNVVAPTFGGTQFWTDRHYQGGWRIQQNSETGHFRLLDRKNFRQAWGKQSDCEDALQSQILSGNVVPDQGRLAILLHGLLRSSDSMKAMSEALRKHGFTTINFSYASSRGSVQNHAAALREVINGLGDGVTEINFVGHSLGNIVVRSYVGGIDSAPGKPLGADWRIRRMVMLGPPNQGSKMARVAQNTMAFRIAAGMCGQQLSRHWGALEKELGVPDFEFGIIAGGQSQQQPISNVLLPGSDDFTVSVEETKLAGASDFLVAPLLHTTMMRDNDAILWTINFLKHGYFKTPNNRNPLPR